MDKNIYRERIGKCCQLMIANEVDVLLLAKPANMAYLTGDGRLCAFAMITKDGKVALGVPKTDVDDVKSLAPFDHIAGFEDEVGMIHSIAHYFEHFGISQGAAGLEYTFLTQSMMAMLTHPHGKPEKVTVKDCTHIFSALRIVKDAEEIDRIRVAGKVEESPLPAGHAFFHGEKEAPPLQANVVIAVGNCGLYLSGFGVRVEDTVVVTEKGPLVLTEYPYHLEK